MSDRTATPDRQPPNAQLLLFVPRPPAAPTDADPNILKALLNATFRCAQCGRQHKGDTAAAQRCVTELADRVPGWKPSLYWAADLDHHYSRHRWRQHNQLWTPEQEETFLSLTRALDNLKLFHEAPRPTPAELASPTGLTTFTARYDAWQQETQTDISRRDETAAPLLAQLDALLPPPHPAGRSSASRTPSRDLVPDRAAAAEIDRVRQLFTPRTTRRRTDHRTIVLAAGGFGSLKPRRNARRHNNPLTRLNDIFSSTVNTWRWSQWTMAAKFAVDDLGLDPRFWRAVELYRGVLTLTTHDFTTTQEPKSPDPPQDPGEDNRH